MTKLSSKQTLLALLLVGFGGVLVYQYKKGAFSTKSAVEAARAAVKEIKTSDMPQLIDVSLQMKPNVKIRNSRNLFNYAKSPSEIAEIERQRREADRLAREAAEQRRRQQEAEEEARRKIARDLALNPPPEPAPTISFRFIGKMGVPRAPIAILVDPSGGDIYTVREGEMIGDKFRVHKIEYDSVTIGYVDPRWKDNAPKVIRMGS